jgi:hypothetical protein
MGWIDGGHRLDKSLAMFAFVDLRFFALISEERVSSRCRQRVCYCLALIGLLDGLFKDFIYLGRWVMLCPTSLWGNSWIERGFPAGWHFVIVFSK